MADWLAQLSERLDQLPAAGLAAPPEPTLEPLLEPEPEPEPEPESEPEAVRPSRQSRAQPLLTLEPEPQRAGDGGDTSSSAASATTCSDERSSPSESRREPVPAVPAAPAAPAAPAPAAPAPAAPAAGSDSEEDDGISSAWLEQSVDASHDRTAEAAWSADYQEQAARLAHERARLQAEWEQLTVEKEKLAAERRDSELPAATAARHHGDVRAKGTPSPYAALSRPSTARRRRGRGRARPGSAPVERRRGGHRSARRRAALASEAAREGSGSSTPALPPDAAHQDVGEGWQLVLWSSPERRRSGTSHGFWHEASQRSRPASDPPPHIEPGLRRLLSPDGTGCVSATTFRRLVSKSVTRSPRRQRPASARAAKPKAAKPKAAKAQAAKPKAAAEPAPLTTKKRRRKRRSKPMIVKLQQRAEVAESVEMETLKAEWLASRPKDYLAELSNHSIRSSSPRSRRGKPGHEPEPGSPQAKRAAKQRESIRGRGHLREPAYSVIGGDWVTRSVAWPADSNAGRELLARTEARRASRADYNRWVRDGADPKALEQMAREARAAEEKAVAESAEQAEAVRAVLTAESRENNDGAAAQKGGGGERVAMIPSSATPNRLLLMMHGMGGAAAEAAQQGAQGASGGGQGEQPEAQGQEGEEEEEDEEDSYRAGLQTDLAPKAKEEDMEAQMKRAAAQQAAKRRKQEAEKQRDAVFEAVRADDSLALRRAVEQGGTELLFAKDRTGVTAMELAVDLKKASACEVLVEVADQAEAAADEKADKAAGEAAKAGVAASPGRARRGLAGGRLSKLSKLKKAATQIGRFTPEVGMMLRAKKRPLGHRYMQAGAYYQCIVLAVNADGSMRVRYPDEGRRGIEDEALTVDCVDLASAPGVGSGTTPIAVPDPGAPGHEEASTKAAVRGALADLF